MKKIYFVATLIVFSSSCINAPERNCSNFKVGTFTFATTIKGESQTTTFTRNSTIEIGEFNGVKDTATVRWINDCEYILKKVNPKNKSEEKPIHIKILTTSNSSYTFEYNAVGSSQKLKGEAIKIH
jgi:hypothetical protein